MALWGHVSGRGLVQSYTGTLAWTFSAPCLPDPVLGGKQGGHVPAAVGPATYPGREVSVN